MRFEAVVDRLRDIPAALPPPPTAVTTFRIDGDDRPPARTRVAPGRAREAAVLVLIVRDEAGDATVVLTERAARGGHHSGEVSLPGGRAEPEDDSLEATALREAAEEIALDAVAAGVRVVGRLEPFWIPVSDYRVTPVVAVADRMPVLAPAEAEVARIVLAPLRSFLPGAPVELVESRFGGSSLRYGAYPVEDLKVWGATARILGQLGALLENGRP